jgi:hypothetical protein
MMDPHSLTRDPDLVFASDGGSADRLLNLRQPVD